MAGKTQSYENSVLNTMRGTTLTSWTPYIGLFTTAPTDTTGGTEASGGNYARQAITFSAPSGSPAQVTHAADVVWSAVTWTGTVVAWGIFDASTAGTLRYWYDCPDQAVASGNNVRLAAGTVIVQED